jgi:trigger factor
LVTKRFIPGFEEQLIGKKKGDKVEVKVTFPDDYFEENLKSKEAVFEVEIKDVKEKELPQLDDEFAKDISEFETLEEYKKDLREKLEKDAKNREKVEFENKVVEAVVESSEVDIPEVMIEHQIEHEINEFNYRLKLQGLDLDQYLQLTNSTLDNLKEQIKPIAEKKVKTDLVFEAIGKKENVEITDEDVDMELEKIAKEYNQENVEEFKEI